MAEIIKLSDLEPDRNNANTGTERGRHMIERSLEKLGAGRSILLDKNGKIIAGNKTAGVAGEIGIDDVVVVRTKGDQLVAVLREDLDLDDPTGRARELAYADNRAGQVSLDFDPDVIADDFAAGVDLSDWFTPLELEDFGVDIEPELKHGGAEAQISRADELQQEWGTELGQMWRLPSRTEGQEHRLICGDCTDADYEPCDFMITDPPYGVSYVGKTADALTVENDSLPEDELSQAVGRWFDACEFMLRSGAYVFATVPPGPLHSVFLLDWKSRGWLRQVMVWVKDSMVLGHSEYHYRHEPILFGWKPDGDRLKNSDRTKTTVWEFDRPKASREHPTMKPVEMWEYAIQQHTRVGDLCLEPFSGSGTTIIAAENLSRQCRAIEISPAYVAVALQRYKDAFGIEPELVS